MRISAKDSGMKKPRCRFGWMVWLGVISMLTLSAGSARATLFTSKAAATGDWSEASAWTNNAVPGNGDDVEITNAGSVVILSGSSPNLNSLIVSRTLLFTNWDTTLSATNVWIASNGFVTCAGPFTNGVMSNNVLIACSNLTVAGGGRIDVNAKGYAGGTLTASGQGPGGGSTGENGGGASYGGKGGAGAGTGGMSGAFYGSEDAPIYPGSGGGGSTWNTGTYGTPGGGAVRIQATGTVTVNGTITANGGAAGTRGAAGSGGGIAITCHVFSGTNGMLSANGGSTTGYGGGGGGGRIALSYNLAAQASQPKPSVTFSARESTSSNASGGDIGTLSFPDNSLLNPTWLPHRGQMIIPDFNSWSVDTLLANGHLRFPASPGLQLTVTNAMTVTGSGAVLWLRNGTITCGGDLIVTNGASVYVGPYSASNLLSKTHVDLYSALTNVQSIRVDGNLVISNNSALYLYSAMTNSAQTNAYGALLDVSGDVLIGAGSKLVPGSDRTNGASPLLRMRNLNVNTGGLINADAAGFSGASGTYSAGYGPGKGAKPATGYNGSGGGYGGVGGGEWYGSGGGPVYGSSNAPTEPGSGASAGTSFFNGFGGGLVRVEVQRSVTVDGIISANGGGGAGRIGGGSGGGISIRCRSFYGKAGGLLRANGGSAATDSYSGGGGGGRIAVYRLSDFSGGLVTTAVNGGWGHNKAGAGGTVVWGQMTGQGAIVIVK